MADDLPKSRPRRFTLIRVIFFLALVAGLIVWRGYQKIATGPAEGTTLDGPNPTTQPAGDTLLVAAYNIAGGVGGTDRRKDLDRTARALAGYDLIGLEEVHGHALFSDADQSQILGDQLHLNHLFAPVEIQWWRPAFGDAILTNLPTNHWQRLPLAGEKSTSNRELLYAQLDFHGQPLNVLITHLERANADERADELHTSINLFNSLQPPVILMGDLNTLKDDPQIKSLRARPGIDDPIGLALSEKYPDTIDWIFGRGLIHASAGFTDNGASDHPLVWAELRMATGGNP